MSNLKRRVEKLEKCDGDGETKIIVCWHMDGEPCDCAEGADKVIEVRWADTWPPGAEDYAPREPFG